MFSQAPSRAWTGNGGASAATTFMAASTAALPAMSPFMVTMLSVGLSESPPESKVMALPTSTSGLARLPARRIQETFTNRGSSAEPRVTPWNMPIPSDAICFGPRTSQRSPASRDSSCAARASRVRGAVHRAPR